MPRIGVLGPMVDDHNVCDGKRHFAYVVRWFVFLGDKKKSDSDESITYILALFIIIYCVLYCRLRLFVTGSLDDRREHVIDG